MLKLNQIGLILWLILTPLMALPVLAQPVSSPASSSEPDQNNPRRPRPEGITRQRPDSSLDNLEQTFEQNRRSRDGAIRRGAICAISPATDRLQPEAVIWSDRSLFLWQTNPTAIQVTSIQVYDLETNEIVWETSLAPTAQSALYDGDPLQPGQLYVWELKFQRQNPTNQTWEPETLSYTFQVLGGDRRDQITTELQQLSRDRSQSNPDIVAANQANYLMQQGLLSDGLQTLYAIDPATPELTETLQNLINSVCAP